MSYEIQVAKEEDETLETLKRMKAKGVRRMPVVNGEGVLVGILTVDDLIAVLAEQMKDLAALIDREQAKEHESRTGTTAV